MSKTKSLLASILLLSPLAHATPNMFGGEGDIRVFSAKTLGKGKVVFAPHVMVATDTSRLVNSTISAYDNSGNYISSFRLSPGSDLTEVAGRVNLALGFTPYFDAGFSIPAYADDLPINSLDTGLWEAQAAIYGSTGLKSTINGAALGDPRLWLKLQYPMWPHSHVFDMAFLFSADAPFLNRTKGILPKEIAYAVDTSVVGGYTSPFNAFKKHPLVRAEMLWTTDFSELPGSRIPLELNLNYGLQTSASLKPAMENTFILAGSAKLKFPMIDLFGEYYGETRWKNFDNGYNVGSDPNFLTGGLALKAEGRRAGAYFKFAVDKRMSTETAITPIRLAVGGGELRYSVRPSADINYHVQISGYYRTKQDIDEDGVDDELDKCREIKGEERFNGCPAPDLDGDQVCDAWVSSKGLLNEFTNDCQGVDACPETKGALESSGCPGPDTDKDQVCDAWVSEKGLLDQFIMTCKGVDKCPELAGLVKNDGCPVPDGDKDGICDEWVTKNNLNDKFAYICKGVDKCPKVQGRSEYFGCPSPDGDEDGVCDLWVSNNHMEDQFKGQCSGGDVCPDVTGSLENKGCTNPDLDGDKFCDNWVAEKGLALEFKNQCQGLDKCPAVAGTAEGCPNVDADGDKVCDSWVAEKGLLAQFSSVCKGMDKCDGLAGAVEFDGCPVPDTDKDQVCDAWVSEKGMLAKFSTYCEGLDKCPTEMGVKDNNGCPKPVQLPPKAKIVLKGVNFASGKADLLPTSYAALEDVVKGLIENPDVVVEIHGHTDNVGNAKSNEKLSLARAKSVAEYLIGRGVKTSQISGTKGWGPKKPIASNKTAEGKAQNRRIEMVRVK